MATTRNLGILKLEIEDRDHDPRKLTPDIRFLEMLDDAFQIIDDYAGHPSGTLAVFSASNATDWAGGSALTTVGAALNRLAAALAASGSYA